MKQRGRPKGRLLFIFQSGILLPNHTVMKKKQINKPLHKKIHRRAKLLVVPHAQNKYQPHLIRKSGIVAVLLLVVVLQAFYIFSSGGFVLGDKVNISTAQLLQSTNKERTKNGLAPLKVDNRLTLAATKKAQDMLANGYWAHTSPQGVSPWEWIKDAHYNYSYAGENLAKNFSSASGVVDAWMHSEDHRDNIMNTQYRDIGFGVVKGQLEGQPTTIVVAMYGAPRTTANLVSTEPTVLAATNADEPLIAQFGAKVQTMAPTMLGSVILLLFVAMVAVTAQFYRKKLPRNIQRSWLKHHGAYKAFAMATAAFAIVVLYNGGQI